MTVYQDDAARMENSVWRKGFASVSSDSYVIIYSSVNLGLSKIMFNMSDFCIRRMCE